MRMTAPVKGGTTERDGDFNQTLRMSQKNIWLQLYNFPQMRKMRRSETFAPETVPQ
jgi:hypothetical protein